MVRRLKEGYQGEDFVVFLDRKKLYTGLIDSEFTRELCKLMSLRAMLFGVVVDYLEDIGVSDINYDDIPDIASMFTKSLQYDIADGEEWFEYGGLEIFPESDLAESINRKKK